MNITTRQIEDRAKEITKGHGGIHIPDDDEELLEAWGKEIYVERKAALYACIQARRGNFESAVNCLAAANEAAHGWKAAWFSEKERWAR